jgi:hypothetical protein
VTLILGLAGVLLGGVVLVVSLLLPTLTDGRTSWDEALLGIIPGAIVLAGFSNTLEAEPPLLTTSPPLLY